MQTVNKESSNKRFDWLDYIKAIAMAWIIWNHVGEKFFGKPLILNPSNGWGTLASRVEQLKPIDGASPISTVVLNSMRYVAWLGDHGVALFLIASGFGLAWSKLGRSEGRHHDERTDGAFWLRRAQRIYPTWFFAHILLLLPPALIGWRVSVADPEFYASLLAFRVTPKTLYYGVPAWWFISLLFQLYLLFPFLFRFLQRYRGWTGLGVLVGVSLSIRAIGLWYFSDYSDAWSRGAIFITRVPEFAFGVWLAFRLADDFESVHARLMSGAAVVACIAGYTLGVVLSLTLPGMTIALALCGVTAFLLSYRLTNSQLFRTGWFSQVVGPVFRWVGAHSLALFLVHHPFVYLLVPDGPQSLSWQRLLFRTAVALAVSVVATYVLEWVARTATRLLSEGSKKWGVIGTALRIGAGFVAIFAVTVPLEILTRRYDPQDVPDFGWSERPSLQEDSMLGYRMRSSTRVRLRWQGYDYVVETNSEGFPAPDFRWEKAPNSCRIMALGDAFTSAEGVDTAKAWPRLLQERLAQQLPPKIESVEVLNFGVTGYGPNQYAAIVEQYAPRIDPDVVIIGMFTNDFVDVQTTNDEFREMIGFDRPNADCVLGYLTARHTFRWLRGNVMEHSYERLTGRAGPTTHFFSQLDALASDRAADMEIGRRLISERFDTIQAIAQSVGASVLVANIPAPLQVLDREQLSFLRPCVDLGCIDMEQPQRITEQLATAHGFSYVDLRPALRAVKQQQPYFSQNLHWTEVGHQAAVAGMLPAVIEHLTKAANSAAITGNGELLPADTSRSVSTR